MIKEFTGIIPATFTPMNPDGSLNLPQIKPLVDFLIDQDMAGFYVCGSTGEGPLMTGTERKLAAEEFVKATDGRVPVIVQVGHDSVSEACELAKHAVSIGADATAAVAPNYFKCNSVDSLVDCMTAIAGAAPEKPFFYYHVPGLTGVDINIADFLEKGSKVIPNLAGIKCCDVKVFDFQSCVDFENGKYTMLYGVDEQMTAGLIAGAAGAVGSTFNFMPAVYTRIIEAYNKGDLKKAHKWQSVSIKAIAIGYGHGGQAAFKAIMKMHGVDCGPNRLPHRKLSENNIQKLKADLESINFFDWALKD
ncbi:MAG: dihydrodipicolinate synthase family protein [Phycisphaerae bacterium]|nr:dihydrodipicolinate synthase family protein [Phycisphaerae bacterium]